MFRRCWGHAEAIHDSPDVIDVGIAHLKAREEASRQHLFVVGEEGYRERSFRDPFDVRLF
jgi:hypothetical protein